jgi:hypothetical protein
MQLGVKVRVVTHVRARRCGFVRCRFQAAIDLAGKPQTSLSVNNLEACIQSQLRLGYKR